MHTHTHAHTYTHKHTHKHIHTKTRYATTGGSLYMHSLYNNKGKIFLYVHLIEVLSDLA